MKLFKKILEQLVQDYEKSYALEELCKITYYDFDGEFKKSVGNIFSEAEDHTKILEVLIFMSYINLVSLDPITDRSCFKKCLLN